MEYITPEEVRQMDLDRAKDEIERLKKELFKDQCFEVLYGKGYIDIIDVPLNKLNYYFKVDSTYSLFINKIGIVIALCNKISGNVVDFIVVSEEGDTLFTVNIEADKIKSRDIVKFKES